MDEGGGYMSTYETLTLILLSSNLLISILEFCCNSKRR